jgi:hypothetical protein
VTQVPISQAGGRSRGELLRALNPACRRGGPVAAASTPGRCGHARRVGQRRAWRELVNNALHIHIGTPLLGHLNIQTTRGYVALFEEDLV